MIFYDREWSAGSCIAYLPNVGISSEFQEVIRFWWCDSIDVNARVYIFMFSFEISIEFKSNLIPYFTCLYKIFCKYIYLVFNLLGIYGWPVIKVVPIILKESTLKIGYILNYVFCSFKIFNMEMRKRLSILRLNFCDLICDINYTILNSLNYL